MWARGGPWGSQAGLEPQQVVPERLGAWCGLQKQGLGRRPGQRSWTTKSGSCHRQLLTATQCLPQWPWAFTEGKEGPGKFGKSPIVRQGRGEETATEDRARVWASLWSHRFSAQCSPTPGMRFWKPTALGQELSEWLSSGRPDIRKTPLLGVLAPGHKDRSSHPSPISEVTAHVPACGHQAPHPGSWGASAAETSPFQTEASPCGKQE